MIARDLGSRLIEAATRWPCVTLTGPRQSGKTTLCRALFPQHRYETLEAPDVRAFATEDPRGFLARFPQGAVLDEVQRAPDLLSWLQGVIDADPAPGRWILTGSQNFSLLESISQSLAGRTAVYNLLPLTRGETMRFARYPETLEETLFTGSWPRIFDEGHDVADWLGSYVATYIERDVRTVVNVGDLAAFQRFVALCAGRTSQLLNYSSLAGDCGISQPTARAWLGILETGFVVFRLPVLRTNLRKRLVKTSKLHFYDTGIACWLLGIRSPEQLRNHPLRGPIFETWVVSEVVKHRAHRGEAGGVSFFRDRTGTEADLVVENLNGAAIVEARSAATPSSSLLASARRVRRRLAAPGRRYSVIVVYGGDEPQRRGADRLVPWGELHEFDWGASDGFVTVRTAGAPVAGAGVLALFPDKTGKNAVTDNSGTAVLDLPATPFPVTVFVAARGFAAHVSRSWNPADGPLDVELAELPDGGTVIFPDGTGQIPLLRVRFQPVRDSDGRMVLHVHDLADARPAPLVLEPGEDLHLADSEGREASVRLVEIVGPAALVQYTSV